MKGVRRVSDAGKRSSARQSRNDVVDSIDDALREVKGRWRTLPKIAGRPRRRFVDEQLQATFEYELALRLRATIDEYLRQLGSPHTSDERREQVATYVRNAAVADWTRPIPDRQASRLRLHHLFFILDGWARAHLRAAASPETKDGRSAAEREDDDEVEKRLLPPSLGADAAQSVIDEFCRLYPKERIDRAELVRAIEEWCPAPEAPSNQRGGRRKGRLGKFNALAAAIARTSFAMQAASIEQAHLDWKKQRRRSRPGEEKA